MSMWLSAANKTMGAARGRATRAAQREAGAAQAAATKQIIDIWSGKTARTASKRKTRR